MRRILILALTLLLSGCTLFQRGAAPPPAPPPPPAPKPAEISVDQYFPTLLGSVWKYRGVGNEFAQFMRTVTFRSGNRAQVEDASGANVATVYVITANEVRRVFRSAETEQRRSLLNEKETLSEVILRSPLKQGETWQSGGVTYFIEAVGQTVSVPAGNYKDVVRVKMSQTISTWINRDSYAPGVGLVRRDSTDGTYIVSSLLESYTRGR